MMSRFQLHILTFSYHSSFYNSPLKKTHHALLHEPPVCSMCYPSWNKHSSTPYFGSKFLFFQRGLNHGQWSPYLLRMAQMLLSFCYLFSFCVMDLCDVSHHLCVSLSPTNWKFTKHTDCLFYVLSFIYLFIYLAF